jgi:hypothetical protein
MLTTSPKTIILALSLAAVTPVSAQHADHASHGRSAATAASDIPTEPGDTAFAAITEIVAILSDDPETDWSRVNIDGLRQHLVDMNRLILGAQVQSDPMPGGLRMRIDTSGRGGEAATRMVPAHGPVLAAETGWSSDVVIKGDDIIWTVEGDGVERQIQALGFFGLMAIGDHHRIHHIALARGAPAH